jgi:hypothetical protein
VRRVVHGVLPLNTGDVRERPRWHDGGFVATDYGAIAELHNVRRRNAVLLKMTAVSLHLHFGNW